MTSLSTVWERMTVSAEVGKYLSDTHSIWSRLFDGEHVFTVLLNSKEPGPNDGGYRSIDAALKVKGML